MSLLQSQILGLLQTVLTKMNLWEDNAKKTEELPALSIIEGTGKIRVSVLVDGVWTSKYMTVQQLIDSSSYYIQNQIVSIGEITLDGNDLTIPFAQWIISGVSYSKITDTIINIPFADTGKTRIDIIVATATNTIIRVAGADTIGVAVRPNIPINTVLVTQVNVTDSEILNYPNALFVGEFTQVEWDAYSSFAVDGSYAIINNAGVRKIYWYSQVLGDWFTWPTGGGGGISDAPSDGDLYGRKDGGWEVVPNYSTDISGLQNSRAAGLASALSYQDRENFLSASSVPITDSNISLNWNLRYLFLSLTNDTLSNDVDIEVTKTGGEIDGMQYKIFNGSDHVVTLVPGSGITLIGDNFVIPKNHTAIIRNEQLTGTFGVPNVNEGVFSVTYQSNGVSSGGGAVDSVNGATGAVVLDADDISDIGTTNKFSTAGEKTKLSYITITQAVDLDAIETRVNDLDAAVILKGTWDASVGTFPGAGTSQAGWSFLVTVDGTVDGIEFKNGDRLIAVTDNASATVYASNWYKADYTDKVNTVAGRTGNVTITSSDLSDFNSAVNALIATALASYTTTSAMNALLAAKTDYATVTCWHLANTFSDLQSYFFGIINQAATTVTDLRRRFYAPFTGQIITVHAITNATTPTSAQDVSLKINNLTAGTSVTVGAIRFDNSAYVFNFTGLTFAVTENDALEYELVVPTLTTNGTACTTTCQTIFKKS